MRGGGALGQQLEPLLLLQFLVRHKEAADKETLCNIIFLLVIDKKGILWKLHFEEHNSLGSRILYSVKF
jgi:hypothetical protein